jgi:transposase-like protein
VGAKVKTMADISRIVDLYELYGSYKEVARELDISPNNAKKYLRQVKDVQEGTADEVLPEGPEDHPALARPH